MPRSIARCLISEGIDTVMEERIVAIPRSCNNPDFLGKAPIHAHVSTRVFILPRPSPEMEPFSNLENIPKPQFLLARMRLHVYHRLSRRS